ncbi:bifunctional riboflavin kinase/FMN phosphatase-like [Mercurialis annua]|uniref:bifunctional riboflavin kinase/FMN phosphatase-like n=1 Tax=Mercurialis annua TaxID=3986 RepID=UPI00215FD185|nr:bifunctional riboflavin kinase/FMN phosphatase-like [Mercurialis annua]
MSSSEAKSSTGLTKIVAVILDLDGTLLDSETATKDIFKEFLAKYGKQLDKARESKKQLGMTLQVSAIAIVKDYDLPLTPDQFIHEIMPMYLAKWMNVKALPGADRLIKHLYENGVPFALASNSLTEYINEKISRQTGWKECFSTIVGSDQVKAGKPSPDIFIEAARRMGVDATKCLVIEDSGVGVKAAKAAQMKVVAIPSQSEAEYCLLADSVLHSLLEFQPELWGLPPFHDWISNALPIQPIDFSILYINGFVTEVSYEGKSALPCQVSGLYIGWIKCGMHRILKVLVHIGHYSCSTDRTTRICILDDNSDEVSDQQMHIVLVGYIRGLKNSETPSMDVVNFEEYKSIASSLLDQPKFIHVVGP